MATVSKAGVTDQQASCKGVRPKSSATCRRHPFSMTICKNEHLFRRQIKWSRLSPNSLQGLGEIPADIISVKGCSLSSRKRFTK